MEEALNATTNLEPGVVTLPQRTTPFALGVFCLKEHKPDKKACELVKEERAIVLIEKRKNGVYAPNAKAMGTLINYLLETRLIAMHQDQVSLVNMKLLSSVP
ncbi:MAG: hypothetical protein KJZ65_09155 [Phycisphaerales bacterium]|nr:hypothetical protein [Phycisphaerales bacterium]